MGGNRVVEWHSKSKRKFSGGIRKSRRRSDKKLAWRGGIPTETRPAKETLSITKKGRGKTAKQALRLAKYANCFDKKTNKTEKLEITRVVENKANREFERRNVITKGCLIEVKKGSELIKARVKSRPGQSGQVSAIFE